MSPKDALGEIIPWLDMTMIASKENTKALFISNYFVILYNNM